MASTGLANARASFVTEACKDERCGSCPGEHRVNERVSWPCTHGCHDEVVHGDGGNGAAPAPVTGAVVLLDEAGARDLTDRIRASAETTWQLLLEAHERKAWKPLGYATWEAYVSEEFGMSRSRAYQLIDQGNVTRALEEAAEMSTMVDIDERTARDIKPVIDDVVDDIKANMAAGAEPKAAIDEAVSKAREAKTETRFERDERIKREKTKKAKAKLKAEGVTLVDGIRGIDTLGLGESVGGKVGVNIDPKDHAGEPCHAASVGYGGNVTYICTDRLRHSPSGDSALKASNVRDDDSEQLRDAADRRSNFLQDAVRSDDEAAIARLVLATWLDYDAEPACAQAMELLAVDPGDVGGENPTDTLHKLAARSERDTTQVLHALALTSCEDNFERVVETRDQTWSYVSAEGRRLGRTYLEYLQACGDDVTDAERAVVENGATAE